MEGYENELLLVTISRELTSLKVKDGSGWVQSLSDKP
jgi:hypothetical protein